MFQFNVKLHSNLKYKDFSKLNKILKNNNQNYKIQNHCQDIKKQNLQANSVEF